MIANTTCDIYRAGSAPPSPPDVASVPIQLVANFAKFRMSIGQGLAREFRFTHLAFVPAGTDVRDGFDSGTSDPLLADMLYVPDQSGTAFVVRFVQRLGDGTRKLYLDRTMPTWPSSEL